MCLATVTVFLSSANLVWGCGSRRRDEQRARKGTLKRRDRVRLLASVGALPAGAEGIVCGFYRYEQGDSVVVELDGGHVVTVAIGVLEPVADQAGNDVGVPDRTLTLRRPTDHPKPPPTPPPPKPVDAAKLAAKQHAAPDYLRDT